MGLYEYVSRSARSRLITLLTKKFGSSGLAKALNVTHAAVNKWLKSGNTHPSNVNLQKIIELAVKLNGARTLQILKSDLSAHQNMLESFASRC
jgi:predicted transcriptional regulator